MNEKATPRCQRVATRGANCCWIWSLLRLILFIQVPIRRPGMETASEKWSRQAEDRFTDLYWTQTTWGWLEFGDLTTGGKDHILSHMYMQTEIPQSSYARTITHCPLPLPPTQGSTSQRPRWVGQFRPRTTNRTPIPFWESTSSLSFVLFSLLCSHSPFNVSCFSSPFKLVYRTRWEAACGCPCCHSMMSSLLSFLRWCSFSGEKKKASSFFIFFLFSICVNLSPVFCKWQQEDLPLNVQDVFSHTWTGF